MSTLTRFFKFITRLFSDKGLTQKAYLNALTAILGYAAGLLVGFVLTPLTVAGLGDYFYGMWQLLNRLVAYLTPASGRPSYALKWTLANQQSSTDYEQKRRFVGSTLAIVALFMPLLVGLGAVVTWYVPYWVNAPAQHFWIVRVVSALIVVNMASDALASIPMVTLQGENLGYKRMGMSSLLVLLGGGFTWLALYLKTGIIGIAVAAVAGTIVPGLFYLVVVRTYLPWFGVSKPTLGEIRQMLGLSWWFMLWNLVTSLLLASDVVVLGLFNSVESITNYILTKYVPEMAIGLITVIVFSIVPGLGGIIGTRDYEKVARLRGEIMSLIWLVATALGATILMWNKIFLELWVGQGRYAGSLPHFLIVLSAVQMVFIRSDANIIDLTLSVSRKVLLGLASVTVSIVTASIAVYFKFGIVGLCLGVMFGRLIISVGYPIIISRFLGIDLPAQVKNMFRPFLVTCLLFLAAFGVDSFTPATIGSGIQAWLLFFLCAGATGLVMLTVTFFAGLTSDQRATMSRRIRVALVK